MLAPVRIGFQRVTPRHMLMPAYFGGPSSGIELLAQRRMNPLRSSPGRGRAAPRAAFWSPNLRNTPTLRRPSAPVQRQLKTTRSAPARGDEGIEQHHLQIPAMNRELRNVVAGVAAGGLAVDELAVAVVEAEFAGDDGNAPSAHLPARARTARERRAAGILMPTPTAFSSDAASKMRQEIPARYSIRPRVSPPMPAPMITTSSRHSGASHRPAVIDFNPSLIFAAATTRAQRASSRLTISPKRSGLPPTGFMSCRASDSWISACSSKGVHVGVELRDHGRRRAGRREHTVPRLDDEIRQILLLHRRDFRKTWGAFFSHDRKQAQLAAPHLRRDRLQS